MNFNKIVLITCILLSACDHTKRCTEKDFSVSPFSANGKLVFSKGDDSLGVRGIYSMNLDGTDLKPLAVVGDTVDSPGYPGNILVLQPEYGLGNPRWSPNGNQIACNIVLPLSGLPSVTMLMDSNGLNKYLLSRLESTADSPKWSPDGDKILFTMTLTGYSAGRGIVNVHGEKYGADHQLYDQREFTVIGNDTVWFNQLDYYNYHWGRTNNEIIGTGLVNKRPMNNCGGLIENELFSYSNLTDLDHPKRLTYNQIDECGFFLSPGAKWVGFLRNSTKLHIYSLCALIDDEEPQYFEIDLGQAWPANETPNFNWTRDGHFILFDRDGFVYAVDLSTSEIIRLATFKAYGADLFAY